MALLSDRESFCLSPLVNVSIQPQELYKMPFLGPANVLLSSGLNISFNFSVPGLSLDRRVPSSRLSSPSCRKVSTKPPSSCPEFEDRFVMVVVSFFYLLTPRLAAAPLPYPAPTSRFKTLQNYLFSEKEEKQPNCRLY